MKKLFWISWYQPTIDHRPLTYPPNANVLGWWCTGYRDFDGASVLVSLVASETAEDAQKCILKDWLAEGDKPIEWRFCKIKPNFELGGRFPLRSWMEERVTHAYVEAL